MVRDDLTQSRRAIYLVYSLSRVAVSDLPHFHPIPALRYLCIRQISDISSRLDLVYLYIYRMVQTKRGTYRWKFRRVIGHHQSPRPLTSTHPTSSPSPVTHPPNLQAIQIRTSTDAKLRVDFDSRPKFQQSSMFATQEVRSISRRN